MFFGTFRDLLDIHVFPTLGNQEFPILDNHELPILFDHGFPKLDNHGVPKLGSYGFLVFTTSTVYNRKQDLYRVWKRSKVEQGSVSMDN